MITRVLTHLPKNLMLMAMLFLSTSWMLQSQDVSYTCQCRESLADGVIEFKIRAFGDTGSSYELENAVNLYFDEDLTMPIPDGTAIPDISAAGANANFCITGFSADGMLPTVDVVENGDATVNLQMLTCRTPEVEITPEETDPPVLCIGSVRTFCIEDLFGSLDNIIWTATGSAALTQNADNTCADIQYNVAGTYVINVTGETNTGCTFTDDLVIIVEDISSSFTLEGDTEIYACAESLDQDYSLAGSMSLEAEFKLYASDGAGGLGALLSTTTGSGTGSGSGPTVTMDPIAFPSGNGDFVLVACSTAASATSCAFSVSQDIQVRTSLDFVQIDGPSCTCTNVAHEFGLEDFNNYSGISWSVSPATGWTLSPASGVSDFVDITFTEAGNYIVSASGAAAVGSEFEGCSFVTDYAVNVTDEQLNFIACNNSVNVSLNNNCELDITPDMILEGNTLCNDAYNVVITDAAGNELNGSVTQDQLGQVLTVSVEQICGDNSCWGLLTVEDKSVTPLQCPEGPLSSICFEVDEFDDFFDIVGLPLFDPGVTAIYRPTTDNWLVSGHDNCSDVVLDYSDENNSDDCDVNQTVIRTWTITDVTNGGMHTCSVEISVASIMSDVIQWPANWDSALDQSLDNNNMSLDACNLTNPAELECGSTYTLDEFGNPDPSCTGTPTGLLCSNLIIIGYDDTVLPVCGPAKKILRNWTVWDECRQVESKHTQIITLMNLATTICIAPADLAFSSDVHDCTGELTIPPPIVDGGCLPLKYTVSYSYVSGTFDLDEFISDGVSSDASDITESLTISNIDFSNDSIWVRYIVTDECGDPIQTDGCILEGSLDDTEQPVPACDLNNIVALNETGCAYAGPSTFDDHSWDNCGIYQTVIQRMDQGNCNSFCSTDNECELRQFDFMTYLGEYEGHYYYMSKENVRSQFANAYANALAETPTGGNDGSLVSLDDAEEGTWVETQVGFYTDDAYHTAQTHAQYLTNTGGTPGFPGQNFEGRYVVEFTSRCGWTQLEKFCCSDCNQETMMMMRVIDNYGNHNFCMVNVRVEDYIPPTFTDCPEDITVDCGMDVDFSTQGLNALFGAPTGTDFECAAPTITGSNHTDPRGECSEGSFTRTWSIEDKSGNSGGTCSQSITFANTDPFVRADISWPADAEVNSGCTLEDLDPLSLPADAQGPTWTDKSCSTVVSNYSDLLFTIVDGACQKLVRTWSVVDWCNPSEIYTYDQVIRLVNTTSPTINCPTAPVYGPLANCQKEVTGLEATVGGGDACTMSTQWSHTIEYQDGTTVSGTGNVADGSFRIGSSTITYQLTDACGNTAECSSTITVTDDTAPTPYCHGSLVVPISNTNGVEIWASDIDLGSTDDCGGPVTLSFSETAVISTLTFTCDNVGHNSVVLYVSDGSNVSSCVTDVLVQDNINVCDTPRSLANIQGIIMTEDSKTVDDVEVNLRSDVMNSPQVDMSAEGEYAFMQLPMHNDYQVLPEKNDSYLNGVSTLDLILIQRHILGIQRLDSPYKVIAADINNSERIDGLDLVELRKLILGIYLELPQNDSWRFVESDFTFDAPMSPWPFTEDVVVTDFDHDITDADFIGVKIGDVNLSAITSAADQGIEERGNNNFVVELNTTVTERGNTLIQFVAGADAELFGSQMSFEFNSDDVLAVVPMKMEVENEHIAWDEVTNGLFKMSWNASSSITVDKGDVLFECLLDGDNDSEIALDQSFDSEVYIEKNGAIAALDIILDQNATDAKGALALDQNVPNPFKDNTTIGFHMPQAGNAVFTLTDVDGKLINRIERHFNSGFNQITLNGDDIQSSGVVYYQLTADGVTITKKMIVLK